MRLHDLCLPVLILLLSLFVGRAAGEEQAGKDTLRIDARLESVDVNGRTLTVTTGQNVDAILREKLRPEVDAKVRPKEGERQVLRVAAKADITISFRTSPSVANSLPRELYELDKLTSYPVTIEVAAVGDKLVVTKIIAWRGSPW